MYKIGEFSKLTGISARMLRYYDKENLLKPNILDEENGYRYYSIFQMELANKINYLRNSGFTIDETTILIKLSEEELKHHLKTKKKELQHEITSLNEKINNLDTLLNKTEHQFVYEVTFKTIPSCSVLSLRKTLDSYYDEGALWKELSSYIKKHHITLTNPNYTFSTYHDTDERNHDIDIEISVSVEEVYSVEKPYSYKVVDEIPLVACIHVYGDYKNINDLYLSFTSWLKKQPEYKRQGPVRQIVHKGEWNTSNPNEYLTELQIPVSKV